MPISTLSSSQSAYATAYYQSNKSDVGAKISVQSSPNEAQSTSKKLYDATQNNAHQTYEVKNGYAYVPDRYILENTIDTIKNAEAITEITELVKFIKGGKEMFTLPTAYSQSFSTGSGSDFNITKHNNADEADQLYHSYSMTRTGNDGASFHIDLPEDARMVENTDGSLSVYVATSNTTKHYALDGTVTETDVALLACFL